MHFSALGLFMLVVLFRFMGVPLNGHLQVIVAATLLFVAGYLSVALMLVAWTANLRFASSIAALYSAPAFAFVGITFPLMGMPVAGRVWSALLPLTHYLQVMVDQSMRSRAAVRVDAAARRAAGAGRRPGRAVRVADGPRGARRPLLGATVKTALREWLAEYRRIFLDPGAALILVGALVLYAFFYPIPYRAQVLKHVPVVVVDQDQTDLSRRLMRMIDAHELTRRRRTGRRHGGGGGAVRDGRAGGVVVIPADFERRIRRGEQAHVAAYTDASYFLIYRQVLTGVLEATGTLSAGIEVRRLMAQGMPGGSRDEGA